MPFVFILAPSALSEDLLPRGAPVESVVCRAAPAKSYALYLPSAYGGHKKWPVLYVFDARGRGAAALEVFRAGAERHGWIVASSRDSRSDGPVAPNVEAMKATWADTHERFALDDQRVYAAGFSGGARFSAWLGLTLKSGLAGVIGCGAGFPEGLPPKKGIPFPFFGSVGNRDFNYYEMRSLDRELARLGAPHRLAVFEGAHRWPPPEIGAQAISWMELQAMKRGLRPRDEALVEELWSLGFAHASSMEHGGDRAGALLAFEALAEDFEGLRDVGDIRRMAGTLREDKAVRRALKDEEERDAADRRLLGTLEGKIAAIFGPAAEVVPLPLALADLRIPDLTNRAAKPDRDALSAQRILEALFTRTSFTLFREMREKKDNGRALLAISIAAEIKPESPTVLYDLACQRALVGDRKKALEALRRAVANGFGDLSQIQSDADLAPLREDPEYRKLIEELKAGPR